MRASIEEYGVIFAVAAVVTFLGTAVVRRLAPGWGAVVQPDARRVHTRPTATLGGLAMVAGFLVAYVTAWAMGDFAPIFESPTEVGGVILAVLITITVGAVDDVRDLSAPAKLAGLVLAGSVLAMSGVSIVVFRVPFLDFFYLSPDLSALLTVLWVVGMANAINLIDGLDGLAAGIVAIAAATFFLYAIRLTDNGLLLPGNPGALVAVIAAGLCLGFLPHNWHPARIFMGDAGALTLGVLMAIATMVVGGRNDQTFSGQAYFFFAPIFIPLVILGVPVIDTLFAIVRRSTRRRSFAAADKGHLHHRLMRLGHGQRRSVLILWGWTALLSGFVLYPTYNEGRGDAIVPIGVLAMGLLLYTVLHPEARGRGTNGSDDPTGPTPAASVFVLDEPNPPSDEPHPGADAPEAVEPVQDRGAPGPVIGLTSDDLPERTG
jgi:UDP-GlcNAc:undecaprenyl-phosphate GlcNAc-1-phosphate transferase